MCWDKLNAKCVECNILPRAGYKAEPTMVIVGGTSEPFVVKRECWQLIDNGWKVMDKCPMPTQIQVFSACVVKEGIVVSGGSKDKEAVSECWLLSTSNYQWSSLPELNVARMKHASVCVEGNVYVIGGEGVDGKLLSSMESLQKGNMCSGEWANKPDMPKVVKHPMTVGYGQSVYAFGGIDAMAQNTVSAYVYEINGKSWKKVTDMPRACDYGSAVVCKDMIYLVGGFSRCCMSFDPVLNVWTSLYMFQCRHGHADCMTMSALLA